MKHLNLIIAATLLCLSTSLFAQNNLQFNQIKRIKFSGTIAPPIQSTAGTITVPVNKVWKIESGSFNRNGSWLTFSSILFVDDQVLQSTTNSNTNILYHLSNSPIWLPPGTYNIDYNSEGFGDPYVISISAIEYNVVP
jgi:hypothetical protein